MVGWCKRIRARPRCRLLVGMALMTLLSVFGLLVGSEVLIRRYVGCCVFWFGVVGLEMWLPFWVKIVVVACMLVGVGSVSMGLTCDRMLRGLACFM